MDNLTGEWKNLYDLVLKPYSIHANALNPEKTTTGLHIIVARSVTKPQEGKVLLDYILGQPIGAFNWDVQDENGATPLFIAALKGNLDAVKGILSKNASMTIKDKNGFSPFYIACLMATREATPLRLEILDAFLEKIGRSFNDELTDELNSKWTRLSPLVRQRLREAGFRSQANIDREEAEVARQQAEEQKLKTLVEAELAEVLPKLKSLTPYESDIDRNEILRELRIGLLKLYDQTTRKQTIERTLTLLLNKLKQERKARKDENLKRIWETIERDLGLDTRVYRVNPLPYLRARRVAPQIVLPTNQTHRKIFEDLRKLLDDDTMNGLPESEYQNRINEFRRDAVRIGTELRERIKVMVDQEIAPFLPTITDLVPEVSQDTISRIIQLIKDKLIKIEEKEQRDLILQQELTTLKKSLQQRREQDRPREFERIWIIVAKILSIPVRRGYGLPGGYGLSGITTPYDPTHRSIFEDLNKLLVKIAALPKSEYDKAIDDFIQEVYREKERKIQELIGKVRTIRTNLSDEEIKRMVENFMLDTPHTEATEEQLLETQRRRKAEIDRIKEAERIRKEQFERDIATKTESVQSRITEYEKLKAQEAKLKEGLRKPNISEEELQALMREIHELRTNILAKLNTVRSEYNVLYSKLSSTSNVESADERAQAVMAEIWKWDSLSQEENKTWRAEKIDIEQRQRRLDEIAAQKKRDAEARAAAAAAAEKRRLEAEERKKRKQELEKRLAEKMREQEDMLKRLTGWLVRFQDENISDEDFEEAYKSSQDLINILQRIKSEILLLLRELIGLQKTDGDDEAEITSNEELLNIMREESENLERMKQQIRAEYQRKKEERVAKKKRAKEEKNRSLPHADFFALLADTETREERARELLGTWRDRVNELVDSDGDTALMIMIRRGFLTAAADLLAGANVEQRNSIGETAATLALDGIGLADTDDEALQYIEFMVNARMNLNTQDKNGNTALLLSIENEYGRAVRRLKELGVDISLTNKEGDNAAKLALKKLRLLTTSPKDNTFIKLLIHNLFTRENIDTQDDEGKTILIYMATFGIPEETEHLLALGPDMNIQDNNGRTALMMAALRLSTSVNNPDEFNRFIQTMRVLLTSETIDVNLDDKKGLDVGDVMGWVVSSINNSDELGKQEKLRALGEIQSLINAKRHYAPRRLLGRMLGWRGGERKTLKRSKRASNKKGKTMRKK